MGLESATYIHQLNPANPVGAVDPKAQGDDHIRMVKSTLQATFPNITGAMTVTQANLNQWAGLAAAYAWTGQNSWSLSLRAPDGTAAAPAFTFTSDTDSGLYRVAANRVGISVNGAQQLDVTTTGVEVLVGQLLAPNGSAAAPGISFGLDANTGIYRVASDYMGFVANGAFSYAVRYTGAIAQICAADGTAATPIYTFDADTDTGIYRGAANSVGFVANGTLQFYYDTASIISRQQNWGINGTAALPTYTFESDIDTGMYRHSANTIGFSNAGVLSAFIFGNGTVGGIGVLDGDQANPAVTFISDTDTGLYRISANALGFTEGGTGYRIGFRNVPRSTTTTTIAGSDNGKCIAVSAAINIPASVFSAGDCVSIYNDSAASVNITISAGTLRLAGTTTTGTRTLAARGMATLWFNVGGATPEVIASGAGVS